MAQSPRSFLKLGAEIPKGFFVPIDRIPDLEDDGKTVETDTYAPATTPFLSIDETQPKRTNSSTC